VSTGVGEVVGGSLLGAVELVGCSETGAVLEADSVAVGLGSALGSLVGSPLSVGDEGQADGVGEASSPQEWCAPLHQSQPLHHDHQPGTSASPDGARLSAT